VAVNTLHYIFAATSTGIYRSTDSGDNWSKVNSGLTNIDVRTIAIDSKDRIFAGTELGGIFISTNNGNFWIPSSVGLTVSLVDFLAISPNNIIYTGSATGHVFRSTDTGVTWEDISPGTSDMAALVVDSLGTVFVGGSGVYRSTNDGISWEGTFAHSTPHILWAASMAAGSQDRVFLGNDSGIFVTSDSGSDWIRLPLGTTSQTPPYSFIPAYVSEIACGNGGVIAGSNLGTFLSKDGGNTWSAVNSFFALRYSAIGRDSSATLFAATADGVTRSFDSGVSWHRVNSTDLPPCQINALAKSVNGRLFAATSCGVYVSSDDGNNWSLSILGGGGFNSVTALPPSLVLVTNGAALCRSSDEGVTWSVVSWGGVPVCGISADHLVARSTTNSAPNNLMRSVDQGLNWAATTMPEYSDYLDCIALSPNGILYAGAENSDTGTGLFRSTNYGDTWQHLAFGGHNNYVFSISIMPNGHLFVDEGGYQFRSSDGGLFWADIAYGDGAIGNSVGDLFLQNNRSTDDGNTWMDFSSGLPGGATIGPMAIDSSGRLFGGANGQVFRSLTSTLTVSTSSTEKFGSQTSLSICPNPASYSAKFLYSLPSESPISIAIYNVLGRVVATPLAGEMESAGQHETTFDTQGLPNGLYWCRLAGDGINQTAKVVISK
jgi:photosystem II stability/assembly factor-like uncharacterized protein